MNGKPWTKEREVQFRKLHAEGLSFTQIAAKLGVTKGAVAGKAYRLGLCNEKQSRTRSTPFRMLATEQQPNVTLFDLQPHHCRWPIGDAAPYVFCADQKLDGSSYCRHHFSASRRVANPY